MAQLFARIIVMNNAEQYWDDLYLNNRASWLGRANATLIKYAQKIDTSTEPRALDLGCSTGGDAVWLAKHGWNVVAVDVSGVALERAKALAKKNNVQERIAFERHDLSESLPSGEFELVSAYFLHSPVELTREQILKKAASVVAPNGILLIVDHASKPPWSKRRHSKVFVTAEETYKNIGLDETEWQVITLGTFNREATGPDGQRAIVKDNVIHLKRNKL